MSCVTQLDESLESSKCTTANSCEGSIITERQANPGDWIKLNVGGTIFTTTRGTLTQQEPESMLARMFSSVNEITPSPCDSNGAYMIDRPGKYFQSILYYLTNGGKLILDQGINPYGVLEEARFYGIQSLVEYLESMFSNPELEYDFTKCSFVKKFQPLTRADVVNALIRSDRSTELRFQGVDLTGANLSKLDLRSINFKYAILKNANLSGCNLSYACLERADLSGCNLDGANLFGVRMICANLENSSLRGVNAEVDSSISNPSMEGVNLKNANLDGSQLVGVNMRVATLKNARLTNCDLKKAVLAGADLENCNLSGSDLQETNLRGANLKDAGFELVMTPVHMAQVSNDLI